MLEELQLSLKPKKMRETELLPTYMTVLVNKFLPLSFLLTHCKIKKMKN